MLSSGLEGPACISEPESNGWRGCFCFCFRLSFLFSFSSRDCEGPINSVSSNPYGRC